MSMKIIISPAKKMKTDTDTLEIRDLPVFLDDAKYLVQYLKSLTYEEAKELWNCSDAIASLNYDRVRNMDLGMDLTPALLSYQGIQYQYMAPTVLEDRQWEYVQEHVYILSGLYGMLRPLDGVVPYRMEMQTKISLPEGRDLYAYWGRRLYDRLAGETDCVVNLASQEYSRCITRYQKSSMRIVHCVFGEYCRGKVMEKGTYAKMARGEMVRYLAEQGAESTEVMKKFTGLGYRYSAEESEETKLVFVRTGESKGQEWAPADSHRKKR